MTTAIPTQDLRRTDVARPGGADSPRRTRQNVADSERVLSAAAALALVSLGLSRKSPLSALLLCGAGGALLYRSTVGYCPAYGVLGINTARQGEATPEDYFTQGIHVEHTLSVMKPPGELYAFWHDFTNLPRFMKHLKHVEALGDTRTRWTAEAPLGTEVSWVAEIIHDQPNELIAWRSMPNADVDNAGSIRFRDSGNGRGTEVKVVLDYIPPAGKLGHGIAKLFGKDPHTEIKDDLRRFKQLMETGEIATTEGQPRGSCTLLDRARSLI